MSEGVAAVVLRWEEPPPAGHRRPFRVQAWEQLAEILRARPGRWALVATGSQHTGTAGQIVSARIRCFEPAGSFEARRRLVDGEVRVYARYVGEVSSCVA